MLRMTENFKIGKNKKRKKKRYFISMNTYPLRIIWKKLDMI